MIAVAPWEKEGGDHARIPVSYTHLSLGKKEIAQMIAEDGQAEVVCQFCNRRYLFDAPALEKLLEETSE